MLIPARSLNARKGELTKTKAELEKALEELKADLATQTANRAEEKAENEQTVPRVVEGSHFGVELDVAASRSV